MFLPYEPSRFEALTAELDRWRVKLDYRGPLPRTWAGRLRRDLEAEAIAASTSMEGVPVTVDEVRRILAGERPRETREEDAALVTGYREAMSFALRRADDVAFRWDRELVVGLHDRVMAGRWGAGAGRFRAGPAYVVDTRSGALRFLPPDADEVPSSVDRVCEQMQAGHPHPALAAAWVHVAVAAIHPFKDGNGRSARVLASLAMYRGGFKLPEFTSLEEWWGRHLDDYYGSFSCLGERLDPTADVSAFVASHVRAQLHQVRALDLREKAQSRIWTAVEDAVTAAGLEPRVANAVWDAFFGREVTPRYYRSLTDVSVATATNDLAGAVAAGLLRAEGKGRARRYGWGDRLFPVVGSAFDIRVDADESARGTIVGELARRVAATEG